MADSHPPRDQQVDDLRQQLRALGYLDAGVDRFVLAPALGARRPVSIAGLASVRIGVLGARGGQSGTDSRIIGTVTGWAELERHGYLAERNQSVAREQADAHEGGRP